MAFFENFPVGGGRTADAVAVLAADENISKKAARLVTGLASGASNSRPGRRVKGLNRAALTRKPMAWPRRHARAMLNQHLTPLR